MRVSAILLAAGLSRRMGRDKLLLPYRGKTLLQRAADLLGSLPVDEKILVTSPARLLGLSLQAGVTALINPNPERGQSESVKLGVIAATGNAYLFLAADQPGLTPEVLQFLLDAAKAHPDKIVYPTVNGRPCSPCVFPSKFRDALLALHGDTGGRTVRDQHPGNCLPLQTEHPACFEDIDIQEDYLRFTSPNN